MYTVYILRSLKDGKKYIGYTSDIQRRLEEHNNGKCKSTSKRKPFELIHTEVFQEKKDATQRELFYKSGHGRDYIKNVLKL